MTRLSTIRHLRSIALAFLGVMTCCAAHADDPPVIDTSGNRTTLPFAISGQVIETITSNGVGINTSAPQATLHVNGTIRGTPICREVQAIGYSSVVAYCGADEYVLNGGGYCYQPGFIHSNYAFSTDGTGVPNAWFTDCYRNDWGGDVPNVTLAFCCKRGT